MAVKTATNYYSNAIVGTPQIGADVNVHETNTSPKFAVGIGFTRSDGSVFRYVQFGSDTNAGLLVSSDLSANSIAGTNGNIVIVPTTATAISGETVKPGAVGSHYIQLKLNGGKDVYAGGYLHLIAGTGAGYSYRIRGNTAVGTPSETNLRLTLYEPIAVSPNENSSIAITGNPWANVIPSVGQTDSGICGVSMASAANNAYGWICTSGIVTVATGNTNLPSVGGIVTSDTGSGGAIQEIEYVSTMNTATSVATTVTVGKPIVGYIIHTGSNGTYSAIALNIGL